MTIETLGPKGEIKIVVRKLVKSDLDSCIRLFSDTVHSINARDYTVDLLNIWAPATLTVADGRWLMIPEQIAYVAEINTTIVGFGDMTDQGYLDHLYVHQNYQGMGVATAIINECEKQALIIGISEITTESSITAKTFFESIGYTMCSQQEKLLRGAKFTTFIMKKKI